MTTDSKTGIFLKQFEVGPMQNFCYVIGDSKSKQAIVVDPAWEASKILAEVEKEGFKLAGVIGTHSHYDHLNAVSDILETHKVPVYLNKEELELSKSGVDIFIDVGEAVRPVWDEEKLKLGDTVITFLHTPGHSSGSQCVLVGESLITGDTLFIGGCGRYDLPGGDAEALQLSLKRISQLPGKLTIYPGHNYGVVPHRHLELEMKENNSLRFENE